jgi:hypothetical protein
MDESQTELTLPVPMLCTGSGQLTIRQTIYMKNVASNFKPLLFILMGEEAPLYRRRYGNEDSILHNNRACFE